MAISTTTVTGPVLFADGTKPTAGKIVFELSSWDREPGEALFVSGPFDADLDENGDFSLDLFSTTEGENGTVYRVFVIYLSTIGCKEVELIGSVSISGTGPFKLADLPIVGTFASTPPDILALVESYTSTLSSSLTTIEAVRDQNAIFAETTATNAQEASVAASNAQASETVVTTAQADILSTQTEVNQTATLVATANNEVQQLASDAQGYANSAANSATASASSETNAAASASNAGSDASAANTERLAAEAAATQAISEKDTAVSAAQTATNAASAASSSESIVTTAKNDAEAAATAAASSESNAASSASAASSSASAANSDRVAAQTAESNASASASSAASAESNASGSASSAASSASTATAKAGEAASSATIAQQAEANVNGKLSSLIALRVKSGTSGAKLELVAADDPTGTAESGVTLEADSIQLTGDTTVEGTFKVDGVNMEAGSTAELWEDTPVGIYYVTGNSTYTLATVTFPNTGAGFAASIDYSFGSNTGHVFLEINGQEEVSLCAIRKIDPLQASTITIRMRAKKYITDGADFSISGRRLTTLRFNQAV